MIRYIILSQNFHLCCFRATTYVKLSEVLFIYYLRVLLGKFSQYFRFSKTNYRHIGILLPVYNLTAYITMACCPFKCHQVSLTIHAKAISIYRKCNLAWAAILDLYYGVARPPTKPRWWSEEASSLLLALSPRLGLVEVG